MVSKLGKYVFLVPKCFQYQKSTMPCPKFKFSTFIRFLPRYWPNPESLVTIGQTDLSPQILGPKFLQYLQGPKIKIGPNKIISPRDNPKDARNIKIQTGKSQTPQKKNTPKYPKKEAGAKGEGRFKFFFLYKNTHSDGRKYRMQYGSDLIRIGQD